MIVSFILVAATSPQPVQQAPTVSTTVQSQQVATTTTPAPVTPIQATTKKPAVVQTKPASQPVTPAPVQAPAPAPTPAPAPAQPVTLLDISGSGSKSTQSFTTSSNSWELDYSYDCSNFGSQGNFQVYIQKDNGAFTDIPPVNELGSGGSDTEYYHEGGTFYLEVNSECSWHVTVKG